MSSLKEIFSGDKVNSKILYDCHSDRAKISLTKDEFQPIASIAMRSFDRANLSFLDNLELIWKKKFSWNWIKVNDENRDSTQLINMGSIIRHLGMTSQEIRDFNRKGKLYQEMCARAEALKIEAQNKEFKPNLIQNQIELKKLMNGNFALNRNNMANLTIYFDDNKKSIELENQSDLYSIDAVIYLENTQYYIKIDSVKGVNPFSPIESHLADRIRNEILEIYKTA